MKIVFISFIILQTITAIHFLSSNNQVSNFSKLTKLPGIVNGTNYLGNRFYNYTNYSNDILPFIQNSPIENILYK